MYVQCTQCVERMKICDRATAQRHFKLKKETLKKTARTKEQLIKQHYSWR